MEETKIPNEVNEAVAEIDSSEMSKEELEKAIGDFLTKERGKSMILGYRVACQTILQMIAPCLQPNCSKREHERVVKKIVQFCDKALQQDEEKAEESTENQGDI